MKRLLHLMQKRPLGAVLLMALALRFMAVFTAPGYLMVDDHFLVVEAGASWADGEDYNNWLPWNQGDDKKVHAANFAYVGTQFIVFKTLRAVGMSDPKAMMLVVRFLHALYSLLIVYFAFLITRKLSNSTYALYVGLLLAAGAVMPNFSVRQLVEFVCIPPMLLATWALVRHGDRRTMGDYALAGLGIGLATGFRYQCGVFGVGIGLALIIGRDWKGAFSTGFFALVVFALSQIQDLFIWGEPFTQLRAYVGYNESHAASYPNGPWYMYLLTLAGYLVPPLSIVLIYGFFKGVRKHLLVVLPALVFLVFHSLFPNKQERFIFPIIPYVVIAGVMVWGDHLQRSTFWQRNVTLWKALLVTFLVVNTLGLAVLTTTYGKRSRVESMYQLYTQGDLSNFTVVYLDSEAMPPLFYSGSWEPYYWFRPGETVATTQVSVICAAARERKVPNYVLFYGNQDIDEHVTLIGDSYGGLDYLTTVEPGFFDRLLHFMNPRNNTLETVHIYRAYPERICLQERHSQ